MCIPFLSAHFFHHISNFLVTLSTKLEGCFASQLHAKCSSSLLFATNVVLLTPFQAVVILRDFNSFRMIETTLPSLILTFEQISPIVTRPPCSISSRTASMFAGVTLVSNVSACSQKTVRATQTLGLSIMFHPQTMVAIHAKFQRLLSRPNLEQRLEHKFRDLI